MRTFMTFLECISGSVFQCKSMGWYNSLSSDTTILAELSEHETLIDWALKSNVDVSSCAMNWCLCELWESYFSSCAELGMVCFTTISFNHQWDNMNMWIENCFGETESLFLPLLLSWGCSVNFIRTLFLFPVCAWFDWLFRAYAIWETDVFSYMLTWGPTVAGFLDATVVQMMTILQFQGI